MKHLNYLALAAIVGFLTSTTAQAALIVDWGGNYVSSTQNLGKGSDLGNTVLYETADTVQTYGGRGGRPFSLSTARSPGSNYSGTSDTFYGGVAILTPGGSGADTAGAQFSVANNGVNDRIQLGRFDGTNVFASYFSGYTVWKKEDFLGGADLQTVTLGSTPGDLAIDSISATTAEISAQGDVKDRIDELRWWLESGGNFYLSQDVTGGSSVGENTTWTTTDFSSLMWTDSLVSEGSYNRMYYNGGSAFGTASSALTDITAIGFMVEAAAQRWRSGNNSLNYIQFSDFEVNATLVQSAIPEPTTAGLAILGLAGLGGLRRRRVG